MKTLNLVSAHKLAFFLTFHKLDKKNNKAGLQMQFPGKRQISLNMGCCRLRQLLVNKKGNLLVLHIIGMKLYNVVFSFSFTLYTVRIFHVWQQQPIHVYVTIILHFTPK